jgi:predicted ATP-dependent endonuclease of OLD family
MQRILLNLFVSLKNHQFFLTTHSNHFLDITLDIDNIAIFNVQKNLAQAEKSSAAKPSFHLENVSKGDRSSLRLLGVNNSSVFLTNATIWVEGITDRMYLRNYLKIFQENESKKSQKKGKSFRTFKEDVHFSFVEYGGSCITHWSFVDGVKNPMDIRWLCAESFLLVDRDKAEWKKERSKK